MDDPLHGDAKSDINAAAITAPEAQEIVLHELPGIAAIERLKRGKGEWLTEAEIAERAEKVSLGLFGLTIADTYGPVTTQGGTEAQWHVREKRDLDWENQFEDINQELWSSDAIAGYWLDEGVDVMDEDGNRLRCAHLFERQMICVFRGLIPGAVFTPNGDGGASASAERWGASLEEEARLFKPK